MLRTENDMMARHHSSLVVSSSGADAPFACGLSASDLQTPRSRTLMLRAAKAQNVLSATHRFWFNIKGIRKLLTGSGTTSVLAHFRFLQIDSSANCRLHAVGVKGGHNFIHRARKDNISQLFVTSAAPLASLQAPWHSSPMWRYLTPPSTSASTSLTSPPWPTPGEHDLSHSA